ncbi:MAG TPA: sugar phosphate nucleotidyltransferase [Patescibacteria group bacterium]|nr:sugar phosphate nucleotidyltransferase [Patescibacteria group bacterium]
MKPESHAVILAGGRGTRFWPRSRTRMPKQLLNIIGDETMIQQTVRRISPLFPASRLWVVTQAGQAEAVRRELPSLPRSHVLVEPEGRNTAAAIALAAIHLRLERGDAVMAVLPADHVIRQAARYRAVLRAALEAAEPPGALVVMGIEAKRPETGYGYIERGPAAGRFRGTPAFRVKRFTEKPAPKLARRYVSSGRYFWNAGMFFWRVSTFLGQLSRHLPATEKTLSGLGESIGTSRYRARLRRAYHGLENISVDYAVLEPASRPGSGASVCVLPASVGWSDIGSWAAAYELEAQGPGATVSAGPVVSIDAEGNFFWAPKKLVAAIGVRDLVLVETPDAILICPRERAQDVGRIVKELERQKRDSLL